MSDQECPHQWVLSLAEQGFSYCSECRLSLDLKDLPSLSLISAVSNAISKSYSNLIKAHAILGKEDVMFGNYYTGISAFNGLADINLSRIGRELLGELLNFQKAISKEDILFPIVMNVMSIDGCREEVVEAYDIKKHAIVLENLLQDFAVAALARDGYSKESALSMLALNDIAFTVALRDD